MIHAKEWVVVSFGERSGERGRSNEEVLLKEEKLRSSELEVFTDSGSFLRLDPPSQAASVIRGAPDPSHQSTRLCPAPLGVRAH